MDKLNDESKQIISYTESGGKIRDSYLRLCLKNIQIVGQTLEKAKMRITEMLTSEDYEIIRYLIKIREGGKEREINSQKTQTTRCHARRNRSPDWTYPLIRRNPGLTFRNRKQQARMDLLISKCQT